MDFQLPELGEGVYEAELVSWLVKPGDAVKRGQNLMEVLTDKATMDVPARFAGTVEALHGKPGEMLKIGSVVLTYTPAGELAAPSRPVDGAAAAPVRAGSDGARVSGDARPPSLANASSPVKAGPSVRLMARKLGIDLGRVHGSGPQGRILIGDLSAAVGASLQAREEAKPPPADYGKPGTRIPMVGLRRKIAEHMVLSKRTIPHYSYVDECDVTELARLRAAVRDTYARAGIKLTYLSFLVKAAVAALKEVPIVNSTFDEGSGDIVLHNRYHIGIAVTTPAGLIVPVVHDADRLSLGEVAREIDRLSGEARAGKARREDLRGGTFTVTSVGNIGGLISTPIINHPEVGILGVGKLIKRPVYDAAGNLRPADLVYLSFSFDHRVVDGAVGAAFGNAVVRQLQDPLPLILPEKLV